MTSGTNDEPILVTGGSGYIASWIVKALLDKGYTVHVTVRSVDNLEKVGHLHEIGEKSPGNLVLFEADLLNEGSFDEAMKECWLVLHVASPFLLIPSVDPQETFIKPIVEGTRNVLNSVNKTSTVKRVVLTSSMAAIFGDYQDIQLYPGGIATESNWNVTSSENHFPYSYSKTLAEKLAWKMAKAQDRWDLVVINPCFVFGPSLSKRYDIVTTDLLLSLADGRSAIGAIPFHYPIVDVRDVASAHIKAGMQPNSTGRYLLFNEKLWFKDIATILDKHFGRDYSFPKRELPKWFCWLIAPAIPSTRKMVSKNFGLEFKGDNKRSVEQMGLNYHPAETTLMDHFNQIVEDGLI